MLSRERYVCLTCSPGLSYSFRMCDEKELMVGIGDNEIK